MRSPLDTITTTFLHALVIGAITWVWSQGKLDPSLAVLALLAVVGVQFGERKFGGTTHSIAPGPRSGQGLPPGTSAAVLAGAGLLQALVSSGVIG